MEVEKLPAAVSLDLPLQPAAAAFYQLDLEASALTAPPQDPPPQSSFFSTNFEAMEEPQQPQLEQEGSALPGLCQSTVAAVRVQKMYRSYRTRRRLADSVVVAEELWWAALDFARLNHSTISFFDYSKPESPHSKWNRIKGNASKVGKGLAEDDQALKLAFQHWIEAIDPRHRYGHNLHYYYEEWCKSDAGQPFFYWLDVGDGKNVDLVPKCRRSKLKEQVVAYLGPKEREAFQYEVVDKLVVQKLTGEPLDTTSGSQEGKWIFVMSPGRKLYAGLKRKGFFHHSSFLAGGATIAAGRLKAEGGVLKSISAYSGHYKPTEENLNNFLDYLTEFGVDRTNVEIEFSSNEDYYDDSNSKSKNGRSNSPDRPDQLKPDQGEEPTTVAALPLPETDPSSTTTRTALLRPPQLQLETLQLHLPLQPALSMPILDNDHQLLPPQPTPATPTRVYRRTLSGGLQSPRADVPRRAILQRIESKKKSMSYQLGHQLSSKWTTGAGPRIGCVADYPVEVRKQALEFVNLSPRAAAAVGVPTPGSVNRFPPQFFSPRVHSPSSSMQQQLSRLGSVEGGECSTQLSRLGSVEGIEC